ncbi:hypothetical protein BDF22DRAFT_740119 [Syncephalis plumigaleata]|nr:hypothetical protein BDF22DRAFT_740119 [Syncephalis plumigaleata]
MAGPRLEIFKFGVYVFFPIMFMTWIGTPEWYDRHVERLRTSFNPPAELCNKPPTTREGVREQVERLNAERQARRQQRQQQEQEQ